MNKLFDKRKESILADLDLIEQLVKMDYYQDAATKLRQVRTKCMNLGNSKEVVESETRLKDESTKNKYQKNGELK